jgi:hypothetical protein
MAKWWMGVALAVVVVGQPNAARAQNPPAGQGPPQEPVPCAPSSLGGLMPGPLTPNMAPPGPGQDLSISANSPGAFSCDDWCRPSECYVSVGAIALQRQNLGHGIVAFKDPGNGTDTGIRPIRNADLNNSALSFNDLHQHFDWGVSGMIGYAVDDCAIELSGFFIPRSTASRTVDNPGRLDLNFINPPLGFEGDNGLWLQADRVRLSDAIQLTNAELNFRYANKAIASIEPLIGVRYFDLLEQLSIFTGDDDLTVLDINGNPNPVNQATYRVTSHSHIIAPQLGFELTYPICNRCVAFVAHAKGAWGANFWEKNTLLVRGDGLVGINDHTAHTQFTHLYDLGFYLDFYLLERMRIRAGYNLLWIVNVPEAKSQINFDLNNVNGTRADHGSIFFSGPQIEMQFLF